MNVKRVFLRHQERTQHGLITAVEKCTRMVRKATAAQVALSQRRAHREGLGLLVDEHLTTAREYRLNRWLAAGAQLDARIVELLARGQLTCDEAVALQVDMQP